MHGQTASLGFGRRKPKRLAADGASHESVLHTQRSKSFHKLVPIINFAFLTLEIVITRGDAEINQVFAVPAAYYEDTVCSASNDSRAVMQSAVMQRKVALPAARFNLHYLRARQERLAIPFLKRHPRSYPA